MNSSELSERSSSSSGLKPKPERRRVDRGGRSGLPLSEVGVDGALGDIGSSTLGLRICFDAMPMAAFAVVSKGVRGLTAGSMTVTVSFSVSQGVNSTQSLQENHSSARSICSGPFFTAMGAYCGGAARIYDANEAIRVNNTGPRAQELLASVNVTMKGRDGRIPFVQACKYGRQRMVEFMIKHDIKQRITAEFVDAGLLQCCGGDTTRNLVFILVEVAGANVNAQV